MSDRLPLRSITYTRAGPRSVREQRHFETSRRMVEELVASRELIWQLFWRDIRARYRQSIFGIAWAVLLPLLTVAAFIFMNRSGLLSIGNTQFPYPLFALAGLTAWQIFASGLTAGARALTDAGNMITKINLPRAALVIAAMGQSATEFAIRACLTAAAFLVYEVAPDIHWLSLALGALVPLWLLTLGASFVLSLIAGVVRDVLNGLGVVLLALLLLTPVLYPLPSGSPLEAFNRFNPLRYLIDVPRDLLLHGATAHGWQFMMASLFALTVFVVGWRLFHIAQPHIAERI